MQNESDILYNAGMDTIHSVEDFIHMLEKNGFEP